MKVEHIKELVTLYMGGYTLVPNCIDVDVVEDIRWRLRGTKFEVARSTDAEAEVFTPKVLDGEDWEQFEKIINGLGYRIDKMYTSHELREGRLVILLTKNLNSR